MKATELSKRANIIGVGAIANIIAGNTCFELGQYEKSQEHYKEAISQTEYPIYSPSSANNCKVALARAKVKNNEKDVDLESLYRYEAGVKLKTHQGWTQTFLGEILLNVDDRHMDEAEEWLKKAIETNKANGTMFYLGQAHALYGELLKRKGDIPEARENLEKAIEIYQECGADGWVKKAEEELVKIQVV